MRFNELTKKEKVCARVIFLNALNDMEREQARDAGKSPVFYSMTSPLFEDMLPESEWCRFVDSDGVNRISLILV